MAAKKIIFTHLLNDFSGSPLVLSSTIRGLQEKGYECEVLTSRDTEGFLSNIPGVTYRYFSYRWHPNAYLRLLLFLWCQCWIAFKMRKWYRKQECIFYINTLLPFGAALAGKWLGKPVVYHIHEISLRPQILKGFLRKIANWCATQSIFVSHYLQKQEELPSVQGETIHNALSDYFKQQARQYLTKRPETQAFTVLMLCSLKTYKGVLEYVAIAEKTPNVRFELVINAEEEALATFFENKSLPENLHLFPKQKNVHPFYQRAHLVLNLSHPEQWVETFGMTLLEGMYYGLPCIAPPIGGPTEIVAHQQNGFLIDQREINHIAETIGKLSKDDRWYQELSQNARLTSEQFSYQKMIEKINASLPFST